MRVRRIISRDYAPGFKVKVDGWTVVATNADDTIYLPLVFSPSSGQ